VTPKELAMGFFEALNKGDAHAAMARVDLEAFVDVVPARCKGTARHEGRRFVNALLAAFPDLLVQVRSIMEAGDVCVAEVKMEGTQGADFLGILNQEKHVDVDQAWMIWASSGKITGVRAYWCQNQLYRRLAVKRLDRISILG
jgi:predicted ester cyclase